MKKDIRYDRKNNEWDAYLDDEYIGTYRSSFAAENELNRLVYERWRDRAPQEVLAWHRQVQEEVLAALNDAPEEWFSGREHRPGWPNDLDSHSSYHRVKDIEQALNKSTK